MRLRVLETTPPGPQDGFVSDMRRILGHRPDFVGKPLMALLQLVLRESPSEWSVGERELIAAFVAGQSQCPF